MKKGDIVFLLPHNPLSIHGIPYGYITDVRHTDLDIVLCSPMKQEFTTQKNLVCVVEKDQCPVNFRKYLPSPKRIVSQDTDRLDRLELGLAQLELREKADRVESLIALRNKIDRIEAMVEAIGRAMGLK